MRVVNFTVEVEHGDFESDYNDYVVLKCNGHEVWRNDGTEYLGRGHGGSDEYIEDIVARKFKELFK